MTDINMHNIRETYTTRDGLDIPIQVDAAGRIYTPQTVLSVADELGLCVVKQRVAARIRKAVEDGQ
jgi:hypothetical protein